MGCNFCTPRQCERMAVVGSESLRRSATSLPTKCGWPLTSIVRVGATLKSNGVEALRQDRGEAVVFHSQGTARAPQPFRHQAKEVADANRRFQRGPPRKPRRLAACHMAFTTVALV